MDIDERLEPGHSAASRGVYRKNSSSAMQSYRQQQMKWCGRSFTLHVYEWKHVKKIDG